MDAQDGELAHAASRCPAETLAVLQPGEKQGLWCPGAALLLSEEEAAGCGLYHVHSGFAQT